MNTNALDSTTKSDACDLPADVFAISIDEMLKIREQMIHTVEGILKTHIPCLKDIPVEETKHQYHEEMCERSNIVRIVYR